MKNKNIWQIYENEKDETVKRELKKTIIEQYLNLVRIISGKLYNYYASNIEFDDLMGYGVIGLIDAIDKFDHTKNIKFETYASIRIRGSIIDQIRNLDWIPRSIRQKSRLLRDAYDAVEMKLGREPKNIEIAEHMGKTLKEIEDLINETSIYNILSIEDDFNESYKMQLSDNTLEASPEDSAVHNDSIIELEKSIESLSEREQLIINLYYYENITYKEIGEILKISESRVSQIHSKAIMKMKKQIQR